MTRFALWLLAALAAAPAVGQNTQGMEQLLLTSTVKTITPVFSQLVLVPLPQGFKPAFENSRGPQYILESVPIGQTVDNWTQMVTLRGFKDLATRAELTPRAMLSVLADGFRKSCPDSFASRETFEGRIGGYEAYAAILSCGQSPPSGMSESALISMIRGQADYYSVQWAERSPLPQTPSGVDPSRYAERMKALLAVRICSRVPGEAPPFPSCIGLKG